MISTEAYPRIVHELNEVRRQWRWTQLIAGGLWALAGALTILVLLVAADNLFKFGLLGRFVSAALLWGGAIGLALTLVVRRWYQEHRDDYFAALVEHEHPELHNRLINALQLGRGNDYGSRRIVEAIVVDASEATAELEMNDCLDWRPVKRSGVVAGCVAAVVLLYAVLLTPRFANGLGRVLLPGSSIQPYTASVINEKSIKPADGARYPAGEKIEFRVRVGGDRPASLATLFRSEDGRAWRRARMHPQDKLRSTDSREREFKLLVPEARASFQYYIVAGDDVSGIRGLQVIPPPKVESVSLALTPPRYTGRDAESVSNSGGEIAALPGTDVKFSMTSSKPLEKAVLHTESGRMFELSPDSKGRVWSTRFVVWTREARPNRNVNGRLLEAPTRYQLKLLDKDGYENADPLWRSITLIKDQPPKVSIAQPGRDTQIKADESLQLIVDARDDYGVSDSRILYVVNDGETPRELKVFGRSGPPQTRALDKHQWYPGRAGIKPGDVVHYWAETADLNNLTGPSQARSRRYALFIATPEQLLAKLEVAMEDYAAVLEQLIRLQRENRAQTASGVEFPTLVARQTKIRVNTAVLSRAMKKGSLPVATMVTSLEELYAGLMADAIRLLEAGRDSRDAARSANLRNDSLPVQDEIVKRLEHLLQRLQRNDQARKALRRLRKKDEAAHKQVTKAITKLISDLDRLVVDETELMSKLEKMPKRDVDELDDEQLADLKQFEEFRERWSKWRKGSIDELTKLPTGFIEDFDLRADVNTVFEEVEAVAKRPKTSKLEVALEDAGTSKATEMLEDLETWMPDAPDALQWVMEEPLDRKPLNMPEMPLPDSLEDLIGELLQEAEEFDEEADDMTSAWGDNLNQAGWGVSDGPISNFSAKGKTGNDLPNANEVSGRAGDGRRGKSSGQMVGDTARGLEGRKTPARLNNERYEQGKLKEEGRLNPNGATGGGKKAGSGRRGLQGGTPPDFQRDMERLSAKQAGMREKAQQVARQLDTAGVTGRRLRRAIELMQSVENDLRDLRYEDAARKRKIAMQQLRSAFNNLDQSTAVQLHQARQLPAQVREELLQAAAEGYPRGYEALLRNYFKKLSEAEK